MFEEVRWTVYVEGLIPAKECPEKGIKTDEMVHMRVGDKDVGYFEQVLWCQQAEISKIKHQCTFFEEEGYEESWIRKRIVDQSGLKRRSHQICPTY